MNVKSAEKKENSTVELVIEVPAGEFDAAVEKVYHKNKGKISIPGFRKGKAPRKIIESMYGANVFYEDAIEAVYPAAYADAVQEQDLDVVAYPSVEVVSAGPEGLTFKATVTVKPEVRLGAYKGLTAPKAGVEVTEEDVEREMKPLIERATRLVSVEREARTGDTVVIDFDGFQDGERFEGGQGTNYELELGSHTFVPGFEDALVGVKAGDEKDIDITFPKEYPEKLANQPAVFKVKVYEVKEKAVPELDDEFAKDVSEFDTLEELKKDLGEKLRQRRQEEAESAFESALMEQVCDNLEVELPDAMVDYRTDEMVRNFAQRVSNQGVPFEEYMKYMGTNVGAMKAQMRPNAIAGIKVDLALEAIAAAEGLTVTEEEMEEEIRSYAEQANVEADQVRKMADMDGLKKELLLRKARKLVMDSGTVGEAPQKAEKGEEQPAAKKPAARKTTKKSAGKQEKAEDGAEESAEQEEKAEGGAEESAEQKEKAEGGAEESAPEKTEE